MPELPEVETTVRGLARVLDGRRIASVEARRAGSAPGASRGSRPAADRVRGSPGFGRRAKYGLIDTDRGDTIGLPPRHVRPLADRSGRDRQARPSADRDRRRAAAGAERARRFGRSISSRTDELDEWPPFAALGPEPFGLDARGFKRASRAARRRSSCCCSTSGIVAGLGNIYVCEALFRAGIHPAPRRRVGLAGRGWSGWPRRSEVLAEAIAAGGSTLRDFASPDGELGYFSKAFAVYDREGRAVRLRRHRQADRPGRPLDLLLPAGASVS